MLFKYNSCVGSSWVFGPVPYFISHLNTTLVSVREGGYASHDILLIAFKYNSCVGSRIEARYGKLIQNEI